MPGANDQFGLYSVGYFGSNNSWVRRCSCSTSFNCKCKSTVVDSRVASRNQLAFARVGHSAQRGVGFTRENPTIDYTEWFVITLKFRVLWRTIRHNYLICGFNLTYCCPPTQEKYGAKIKLKSNRYFHKTPRKLLRWISQAPCLRNASKWAFVP